MYEMWTHVPMAIISSIRLPQCMLLARSAFSSLARDTFFQLTNGFAELFLLHLSDASALHANRPNNNFVLAQYSTAFIRSSLSSMLLLSTGSGRIFNASS